MKYAIKCESLHEKLAILEYLKKGNVAFQETAWDLREKDFHKYPLIYFDNRYNHVGCTHEVTGLTLVSTAELFEIAFKSNRGTDLKEFTH